jgi:hypothetical protein
MTSYASQSFLLIEKGLLSGRNSLNYQFKIVDCMAIWIAPLLDQKTPLIRPTGALTAEQVSTIEKHTKDINQYLQEQAIVFQQIASTILDLLYLKIKERTTMKEAWDMLEANFKKRSHMIIIELQKRLQDT